MCGALYSASVSSSRSAPPALLELPGAHAMLDLNRPEGLRETIRVAEAGIKESENQERELREARGGCSAVARLPRCRYRISTSIFPSRGALCQKKTGAGGGNCAVWQPSHWM